MEHLAIVGTIALVHILACASPGPDFVIIVRNSLVYSRKTGIWTAVGIGLGITVHLLYCTLGLAFIISKSIIAFNIIKLLGAGYLIYLGVKSILSKSSHIVINNNKEKKAIPPLVALRIGFLTNVLNPKATLFFLSLFTVIIKPDLPSHILIFASTIMVINTILWFCLVSIFFSQKRVQSVFERFQNAFTKVFGGLLVALGIKLALTHK